MDSQDSDIYLKLTDIQNKLKAPKGQFNKFGNYHYRNCEDILEAVKPLLREEELTLVITDDLVLIGDRYYIKATVVLAVPGEIISNTAYARESETKKGMDASQITGAASSYARKYALNGMFLIDDTQDADSMDNTENKMQANLKKAELPVYEDFDAHRATMVAKIAGKESTPADIIKNLSKSFRVSDEVKGKIKQLGEK